jgi:hypothetical protein
MNPNPEREPDLPRWTYVLVVVVAVALRVALSAFTQAFHVPRGGRG